jgi:hypothetical protein
MPVYVGYVLLGVGGLFWLLGIGRELKRPLQEISMKFTVGLKQKGRVNHVVVDAEDALIAALKAKTEHPESLIMYVRPQNRRGDARHPPLVRAKDTR